MLRINRLLCSMCFTTSLTGFSAGSSQTTTQAQHLLFIRYCITIENTTHVRTPLLQQYRFRARCPNSCFHGVKLWWQSELKLTNKPGHHSKESCQHCCLTCWQYYDHKRLVACGLQTSPSVTDFSVCPPKTHKRTTNNSPSHRERNNMPSSVLKRGLQYTTKNIYVESNTELTPSRPCNNN